jgi:hypothetical protein
MRIPAARFQSKRVYRSTTLGVNEKTFNDRTNEQLADIAHRAATQLGTAGIRIFTHSSQGNSKDMCSLCRKVVTTWPVRDEPLDVATSPGKEAIIEKSNQLIVTLVMFPHGGKK